MARRAADDEADDAVAGNGVTTRAQAVADTFRQAADGDAGGVRLQVGALAREFGDVVVHTHHPLWLAVVAELKGSARLDVMHRVVWPDHPELAMEGLATVDGVLQRRDDHRTIVRMHRLLPELIGAGALRLREAVQAIHLGIPAELVAAQVEPAQHRGERLSLIVDW